MKWILLAVLPIFGIANAATFNELPEDVKAQVDLKLVRPSNEISGSPFATLTSFEVHGESEDASVIETMRKLGVKTVVMHNIHGSLRDPADKRLNNWLDACDAAGIETRCILHSEDMDLWRAAFTNYSHRIDHWSILNEPNQPQNNNHTTPIFMPERYVEIAKQVRAVRDEVAPDVKLYGPESAMLQVMEDSPFPWLQRCIDAGLLDAVDGVSVHPYRQGYSPTNIPENPSTFGGEPGDEYSTYEGQIEHLREMIDNKPVVVTEVGWSTTLDGNICEHTQAKFALRQQLQDFALGLKCAVYFMIRERHLHAPFDLYHIENHFGIVHTDNSPKPAYIALQTLYSQLDDNCKPSEVPVEFGENDVKWYLYEDESGEIPCMKLFYWLPVPAQDNLPKTTTSVKIGDVTIPEVPVSDAPKMILLYEIDSRWGWPVLVDLLLQRADEKINWE